MNVLGPSMEVAVLSRDGNVLHVVVSLYSIHPVTVLAGKGCIQ